MNSKYVMPITVCHNLGFVHAVLTVTGPFEIVKIETHWETNKQTNKKENNYMRCEIARNTTCTAGKFGIRKKRREKRCLRHGNSAQAAVSVFMILKTGWNDF